MRRNSVPIDEYNAVSLPVGKARSKSMNRRESAPSWNDRLFQNCGESETSEKTLEDSRLKLDALDRLKDGQSISGTLLYLEKLLTNEETVIQRPIANSEDTIEKPETPTPPATDTTNSYKRKSPQCLPVNTFLVAKFQKFLKMK